MLTLLALAATSAKLPSTVPTVGCAKGSSFVNSPAYGVATSRWGNLPRGGWRGAVLGPNGDKIYGIPTNATSVLEIDPQARTVTTFGHLGDERTDLQCSGSVHCGEEKWIGGVLIPDSGKIIAVPYAAETVLEIDTTTRTTSTFGIVSSSVKRKWVDGVLGSNGLVYAIPYDADVVLEIDPDTRALMLFGRVGSDPCKWYGGVLAPNGKIYTIPYSSPYVLEIDTERRIARPFAMTYPHWAKWSGGVLAPNGKIYGIPALSKSILEIDVEREQTNLYGMLPGGDNLQDKWAGGVVAPNGRIYGLPWRSSSVLEFDPTTKAIALLGNIGAANFSYSGGVLAKSGRIVAVPYNAPVVLEIGESVCTPASKDVVSTASVLAPPLATPSQQPLPVTRAAANARVAQVPDSAPTIARPVAIGERARTFVLALLGCPDAAKASEDACFHLSHRTWHSAMATFMAASSTLQDIREQVRQSRLSHVPTNFCFLYNGHALDPNVEKTIQASDVSIVVPDGQGVSQYVVLIDNIHCNIGPPSSPLGSFAIMISTSPFIATIFLVCLACTIAYVSLLAWKEACVCFTRQSHTRHCGYDRVPASEARESQALIETEPEAETKRIPCFQARLRPIFKPSRAPPKVHPPVGDAKRTAHLAPVDC